MIIHQYHPVHFEEWDHRNVDTGIGGSETCQIEMSWRLARRGYEVHNYAPIPGDCQREWRGTHWHRLDEVDWSAPGLWVLYRCPQDVDNLQGQQAWLVCQDEDYGAAWNEERVNKFDKVLALCQAHARHMILRHPELDGKVWVASNGVRMDLIREVESGGLPERNPKKLIYASSPDRGLKELLWIFKRAREYDDQLELHIFYGTNNMEKLVDRHPRFKRVIEELKAEVDQPGVYWRGRVSQRELYREWLSSGIWCYPTWFTETSCITCMEAQSLGAIPITNPHWALAENVAHGVFVQGDPRSDYMARCRYVDAIVTIAASPEGQERMRPVMMEWARFVYNWERAVDGWESWLIGAGRQLIAQHVFQRKHVQGKILNVGCELDAPQMKDLGAVNLDVRDDNPETGQRYSVDVLADIRYQLPANLYGKFDTVVLGEVIEHMTYDDGVLALLNCRKCLRNGGRIVVTCPDDRRDLQRGYDYADGCPFEHRHLPTAEVHRMLSDAGLMCRREEFIDYTHFVGRGIIAEPIGE